MKKIILFLTFIFLFITSINSISIKKIIPPENINGTIYFPLFIGEKWTWDIKGLSNIDTITWEIIAAYQITDEENNLQNSLAFEIQESHSGQKWYLLEQNGFICKYENINQNQYLLTRLLPTRPNYNDTWIAKNSQLKITEINNHHIKTEYINKNNNKYGYRIFKKGIGPYQFFEYSKDSSQKDVSYTLKDHTSFSQSIKPILAPRLESESLVKKADTSIEQKIIMDRDVELNETAVEEIVEKAKVTEVKSQPVPTQKTDDPLEIFALESLAENKEYIQIGSFTLKKNAVKLLEKVTLEGYEAKLYFDKDQKYKILLEVSGDPAPYLAQIKNQITPDAFMKKK